MVIFLWENSNNIVWRVLVNYTFSLEIDTGFKIRSTCLYHNYSALNEIGKASVSDRKMIPKQIVRQHLLETKHFMSIILFC